MRFKNLNGEEIRREIRPSQYPLRSKANAKSIAQYRVGRKLQKLFPNLPILEEFPCVGTKLHLDFFMPTIKIAFEYDGQQHKEFNKFFHDSKKTFQRQQERDAEKDLWCQINNISLIRIDDEFISLTDLRILIKDATHGI